MANDRNLRSGQILTPFGIGQLINFPNDETLMICGLDAWQRIIDQRIQQAGPDAVQSSEFLIRERRLQSLLAVDSFRKPYPFRSQGSENTKLTIPAVRFPRWHYCLGCGEMRQIQLTQQEHPRCSEGNCRGKMIPVRFIAVCPNGHIQDFPFLEWVHARQEINDFEGHRLTYRTGQGSGDLASILVKCSCGAARSLGGIMNEGALQDILSCQGYRPWLGPEGIYQNQNCAHQLRVVIRGSANVHYSVIRSAIYLPEVRDDIPSPVVKIIERSEAQLRAFADLDNDYQALTLFIESQPEIQAGTTTVEIALDFILKHLADPDNESQDVQDETDLRFQEYQYMINGRESENADFKATPVSDFGDYLHSDFLNSFFEEIVLIEKLRETRVFAGFSRINPEDGRPLQDRIADLSNQRVTWLPANIVYGEGIFLKFRDPLIEAWLEEVPEHFSVQIGRYHDARRQRWDGYEERDLNPAFIMMHTFAHMLINRLCFNCGYGSSALRERIYFSTDSDRSMNGIMIYTSSGDSEGSLGGLVRQGTKNFLGRNILEAIEDAAWCSADPVCMDVGISSGQGPSSVNGAACHNCAIVPETSCEEFNMLLDRSTLIGTIDNPQVGFFD